MPARPPDSPWTASPQANRPAALVLGLVATVAATFVLFLCLTITILTATQGYALAEGSYLKSVRGAVGALSEYAATGDEAAYETFTSLLQPALIYEDIRHNLDQGDDESLARARVLMASDGTDAREVNAMLWMYPGFRSLPALQPAFEAWIEADEATAAIANLGARTHADVQSGQPGPLYSAQVHREAFEHVRTIEDLGDRFARRVATVSNRVRAVLVISAVGLALLMLLVTAGLVRRLQERLQKADGRFRQLVHNATDALGVIDEAGRLVYLSPSTKPMLGVAPEEALGRSALYRVHPEDRADLRAAFKSAVMTPDQSVLVRYRWRRPDGTEVLLEGLLLSLLDDAAVRGVVINARDVGDRERAAAERAARVEAERVAALARAAEEEAVRARVAADAARLEAEQMARLQSAFLANMSHEIRTPLTAVLGYAEILADEVQDDLQACAYAVRSGGHRLMNTLTALLDHAQIEAGRMTPRPTVTDVAARLRGAVRDIRPLAEMKGLTLTIAYDLPPLRLDPELLDRIVAHLLSNAVKFTDEGCVSVGAHLEAGDLVVEVADTGIGIDPCLLPTLFTPFQQASDGAARTHEGAGLGLTIVHRVTELMGGTVTAESEFGVGSTFRVRLPLAERPADATACGDEPADRAPVRRQWVEAA